MTDTHIDVGEENQRHMQFKGSQLEYKGWLKRSSMNDKVHRVRFRVIRCFEGRNNILRASRGVQGKFRGGHKLHSQGQNVSLEFIH